ncbi:MAG: hypothetical protein ACRDZ1_08750 [Acidimicrobiia bacterium]
MASSEPTNPSGHAEIALVALATFAVIGSVTSRTLQSNNLPTVLLGLMVDALFDYAKRLYPEHERIAKATLRPEHSEEDNKLQFDSEIFREYYLTFSFYSPFEDPSDIEGARRILHAILQQQAYLCVAQVVATAGDSSTESMDLPTREDFHDLSVWLAQTGYEASEAMHYLFGADVIFGVEADGTFPFATYFEPLRKLVMTLEANLDLDSVTETASWLRQFTVRELKTALGVIRKAYEVHGQLDSGEPLESHVPILTVGMVGAQIPEARAIAAEYVSYIYHRQATVAATPDLAEDLHRAAVAASAMALITSGSCRHAKYVAQNLLDIAKHRDDPFVRQCAEAIWVDAYITPLQVRLHLVPSTFVDLGWTSEVYATTSPLAFADIPAYSDDPTYIYEGAGADVLRNAVASFTTDHLAAAVLLVQYFKDHPLPKKLANPDVSHPLFDPHGPGPDQFPLRRRHPIAWTYYIANALFAEQSRGNVHAGLVAGKGVGWDLRHWVGCVVDDLNEHLAGHITGSIHPGFPTVASQLLTPVVEDMFARGDNALAGDWSRVVESWAVD